MAKKEEKKDFTTKEEKGKRKTKNVKVKVLKNHHIGRIRAAGTSYLLEASKLPWLEKQGYVKKID